MSYTVKEWYKNWYVVDADDVVICQCSTEANAENIAAAMNGGAK